MVQFRIGDHIGSGGFGTVEEAVRVDGDGAVLEDGLAQKKLLPRWENDAEAVARFRREVRILSEMDHPNILPVRGRNLSAKPPWFIMPRADTSLFEEIQAGRWEDEQWAFESFSSVLAGMTYAHAQRRIHRDLKPENVLIVHGVPMIGDFGLGKRLDPDATDLTQTEIGMGTVAYMAPEQFEDFAHVGPPADVYALGKIFLQLTTGARPMVGRPRLDAVPDRFRSFVEKCTADDASDRYANAADAYAAFRLLVAGEGGEVADDEELEGLLAQWEKLGIEEDAEISHAIATWLVAHRAEEERLWDAFPRLPDLVVEQLIERHPVDFDLILRAYHLHIEGGLPFEYCDVVANFYRRVYKLSSQAEHKQLILDRLIELGPSHNRWHVGDVVGVILENIDDSGEAEAAAEIIRRNPVHALWFDPYVRNRPLAAPIAKAFVAIRPQSDDDVSF